MYWCPFLVFGSSPAMSIAICLKDSPVIDIGNNIGTFSHFLAIFWQSLHVSQYWGTSLNSPDQKNCLKIQSIVFNYPFGYQPISPFLYLRISLLSLAKLLKIWLYLFLQECLLWVFALLPAVSAWLISHTWFQIPLGPHDLSTEALSASSYYSLLSK